MTLDIKNGLRGYHIPSCYQVPEKIVAARVAANYTASKGATISYGYYDGAEGYIINKNTALVLIAQDGRYDFVLSAGYYEQINSNSLNGGENAGINTIPMKNNNLRYHYRFVAIGDKAGFERNCTESTQVNLESKDEVYLTINGNDSHFYGNYDWETEDKNWITYAGNTWQNYADKYSQDGISRLPQQTHPQPLPVMEGSIYTLNGQRVAKPTKGLYMAGGRKFIAK